MIKAKNMQHHEKEILRHLEELAGKPISEENASMIVSISRRKSSHRSPMKVAHQIVLNSNQNNIFIQNGRYFKHLSDIDKTEIFWVVTAFGISELGAPQYIISSNVSTDEM